MDSCLRRNDSGGAGRGDLLFSIDYLLMGWPDPSAAPQDDKGGISNPSAAPQDDKGEGMSNVEWRISNWPAVKPQGKGYEATRCVADQFKQVSPPFDDAQGKLCSGRVAALRSK
jgi:hypothetical protein